MTPEVSQLSTMFNGYKRQRLLDVSDEVLDEYAKHIEEKELQGEDSDDVPLKIPDKKKHIQKKEDKQEKKETTHV